MNAFVEELATKKLSPTTLDIRSVIAELTKKNTALGKFIQAHLEEFEAQEEAARNLKIYSDTSQRENLSKLEEDQLKQRAERIKFIKETMKSSTPFERAVLLHFLNRTDKPDILFALAVKLFSVDFIQFQELYKCLNEKSKSCNSSVMRDAIEQVKIRLLSSVIHTTIAQQAFLFAIANEEEDPFKRRIESLAADKKMDLKEPICIKCILPHPMPLSSNE